MMTVDRTKLIEYLLGNLDQATQEQLERQLNALPEGQNELADLEDLLGGVAMTVAPITPTENLRQRVLASLETNTRFEGFVDRIAQFFDMGLSRVRELLAAVDRLPADPWEESGIPGTRFFHFDGGQHVASAHCGLVHIEPGEGIPKHQHFGDEWTFVLQGRLQEDSGQIWTSGDIFYKAPGSAHILRVLGNEPCIFAAVLYGKFELSTD